MITSDPVRLHLMVGWASMLCGALSGAVIGVFFRRPEWLGGYTALPRRLVRLAHIACFGLGLLNIALAATYLGVGVREVQELPSLGLIIGTVSMPIVCLATAWRERLHYFFALPVLALITAIACVPL